MAWSVDQSSLAAAAFEATFGDTSLTYTITATVAPGAWVVLYYHHEFSDTLTGCSGASLSWTRFQNSGTAAGCWAVCVAFAPAGLSGSNAITLTTTGGDVGNKFCRGASFLGGDALSTQTAVAKNSGTSTTWSLPYTTTTPGELVTGLNVGATGPTSLPTGGTNELWDDLQGGSGISANWEELASPGTDSLNGTLSFSDNWGAFGVRIAAAAGAKSFVPRRMPLAV